MVLKALGSILVIVATTVIGFSIAGNCSERPRQIRQILSCILSFKNYLSYASAPLPEALKNCTGGISGTIAELFHSIADLLVSDRTISPQAALVKILKQYHHNLAIGNPEIEALTLFYANLGTMTCAEQQKYCDLVVQQLQLIEHEAIRKHQLNTKMYRYLGICGGLAIVIILL